MIKKLDKLIIKAFIGPFIATFFITLLVLVMQFFWLYIDDFVGKGQISPMFKAVKLKIGGIGPAGVRSFDVDPEQLPESERTVDAEDLADDTFLDVDGDDADDE